jgi:hypothetical protein
MKQFSTSAECEECCISELQESMTFDDVEDMHKYDKDWWLGCFVKTRHKGQSHSPHRTGPLERASEPNRAKITNLGTEVQGHQRRAPPTHYLVLYISKKQTISVTT